MRIPLYQLDAFTSRLFAGNPAAVCPLEQWLPDKTLQAIAAENNLSETAFFIAGGDRYHLRWFTPTVEVDLCGHATLATASLILNLLEPARDHVKFVTKSGELTVRRDGDLLALDFPARPAGPCNLDPNLVKALGIPPETVLAARDYLVVYETEEQIRALRPDLQLLSEIDRFAVIVTAPGQTADFVSRFFAPGKGVPEDPVTGSAHCTLVPYWAQRLAKNRLHALQLSARGGELWCENLGARVQMSGRAVLYLEGFIHLDRLN
ncbi:MAG TPA: PhzF family phenazine biosynthesis protein [Bryobacteraceae bacterium]|nr:PhzF family phenazine biosynthesis protein [Bryobacteraceae bacterium]